jgi:outer membrane protein TolC
VSLLLVLLSEAPIAQNIKTLTFGEAFAIARQNSPNIQQARLSLTRNQELVNAQEASLKSSFGFLLEPFSYTNISEFNTQFSTWYNQETKSYSGTFYISQPLLWTDGLVVLRNQFGWRDSKSDLITVTQDKNFSNNLYLSLEQPIFTYNRQKLALQEVELDLENAALNYNIRELELEKLVAQSFYTAYQSKMSLEVAKEDSLNRQRSYQIIKNKVDAGIAAKEELYQAELDLTTSQSTLQNERVQLQNTLDELKRVLGMDIYDEIDVSGEITQQTVIADLEHALAHGLAHRMELRQRDIDLAISRNNVVRSAATNEFKGNISLSFGVIGQDEQLNQVYETPTRNQRALLSFELPIYDWGERSSRIKAAEASVDQSQITSVDEQKRIQIGIRSAYRNLNNQVLQIDLARQNVKSAQLTYDINLERYENGDLTSMDLNLVQNQLSQRKIGLVNAMINYKLALLDLKIESLWDFEYDRPVVLLQDKEPEDKE